MPFAKGHKLAKGRKAGIRNKRTEKTLRRIEQVLGLLEKTLESDIKELKARERALMWQDLQEYIRPKLARTEIDHTTHGEKISIVIMPPNE